MDFSFSPELQALSDEARRVARETTSTLDVTEDSWLRGVDADFPQILASHGWLVIMPSHTGSTLTNFEDPRPIAHYYERSLDVHISHLRKKLEPLDAIKTLRNAGYALALAPARADA